MVRRADRRDYNLDTSISLFQRACVSTALDSCLGVDNTNFSILRNLDRSPYTGLDDSDCRNQKAISQLRQGDRSRCIARHDNCFDTFLDEKFGILK